MKALRQHIRKISKEDYLQLKDFTKYSKNLYNYANYVTRQYYFDNKKYIGLNTLTKETFNNENYKLLPSHAAQQIIRLIDKNYRSFFALLRKKRKGQYNQPINIPKYKPKDSYFNVTWTYQNSNLINNKISLYSSRKYTKEHDNKKGIKIPFTYNIDGKIKQIQIIPKNNCQYFLMIINYEENKKEINYDLNRENYLSIDLGVNNFATCFNNKSGHSTILNGRPVKSYNRHYNKTIAKYKSELKTKNNKDWSNRLQHLTRKRQDWINNYLNQVVNKIIKYTIDNKLGNILIGESKRWKQDIDLGKVGNQKFTMIPFGIFKQKLESKCEDYGIGYQLVDESYTSKCSALDNETIEKHDNYKGKRVHRGLFKSSDNRLLNADINGSINILRKVVGDVNIINQPIGGLMFNPVKINIF